MATAKTSRKHQRCYFEMVWGEVSLVHAVDETDKAPYGVYYSKTKPLVGAALENKVGI